MSQFYRNFLFFLAHIAKVKLVHVINLNFSFCDTLYKVYKLAVHTHLESLSYAQPASEQLEQSKD